MLIGDHIATLEREGDLLISAVAAADLEGKPPTCPEWTVRELAHHMGRVHRWAAAYVGGARLEPFTADEAENVWGSLPDDAGLVSWLRDGARGIVAALQAAPTDLHCSTFLPAPSPRAFWARRQAHETTIHRVDAQLAVGAADPVPADFAVDGIDELLVGFFSRNRGRLRADPARTLAVVLSDVDASWLVEIGPEGPQARRTPTPATADAEVTGGANAVYLGLWNRGELAATGDQTLVALWRERAQVRWS